MADKKISSLTSASTPLAGTEVLPIVQSSSTVKVSVANLTAGRDMAATSITVGSGRTKLASTYVADVPGPTGNNTGILFGGNTIFPCDGNGALTNGVASLGNSSHQWNNIFLANNVIIKTAAKGVNFTANTPAAGMTSQLLNWYEEGTWTPTVTPETGSFTTVTVGTCRYTRIGRVVTINARFTLTNSGTGAGAMTIDGLPFTISSANDQNTITGRIVNTGTFLFGQLNGTTTTIISFYKLDATTAIVDGYIYTLTATYTV